jgi:hypothetical protein
MKSSNSLASAPNENENARPAVDVERLARALWPGRDDARLSERAQNCQKVLAGLPVAGVTPREVLHVHYFSRAFPLKA